jgi:putative membrane protein
MMLLSLLFPIVVIVGVGAGVWWLVRNGNGKVWPPGRSGLGGASDAAADILRQRFARGEIDRQEFEERRRLLSD